MTWKLNAIGNTKLSAVNEQNCQVQMPSIHCPNLIYIFHFAFKMNNGKIPFFLQCQNLNLQTVLSLLT